MLDSTPGSTWQYSVFCSPADLTRAFDHLLPGERLVDCGNELDSQHLVVGIGLLAVVFQFISDFNQLEPVWAKGDRRFEVLHLAGSGRR
jgi:hypothetical protein